jgi:DNA-binding winged helix-turn-helix (wHTH) protein/TolB-like protein/Tfp pilus assembly protein PilF
MLRFGDFMLDVRQRRLLRLPDGEPIALTAKLFDTLLYFVEHPGVVLEKDTLLQAIWPGVVVEENNLTQSVSALRQVLGETRGENRYIVTMPRRGYRFVATVTVADSLPAQPESSARVPFAPMAVPADVPASEAPAASSKHSRALVLKWSATIAGLVIALVAALVYSRLAHDAVQVRPQQIAVLPFKPLVPSESEESLELGMTESLIARLSAQQGILARPLSSVRRYSGSDQDPLSAGRELGVDSVLESSLQRSDKRIRVSARLLRVADGHQLWAQSFDQELSSIFETQDAIAEKVSQALSVRLSERLQHPTQDAEAFLLYANGRLAWTRLNEASLLQAIEYFEKAIQRDARYALAYAGLADSYAILGVFGMRAPHDVFPQARRAAEQALAIDPNAAPVHATLGHIKIQYDLDWAGGLAHYARAIELDPDYARTYHFRGIAYAMHGDTASAVEQFRRAQQLEPLFIAPRAAHGMILVYARHYAEAIAQLSETLALDERADNARTYLGRAYMHTGEYDRALLEFRKRHSLAPGSYGDIAQAFALSGRHEEARAELQRLLNLSKERHVQALDIATVYASLEDQEKTFEWLERAFEDRSTNLGFLAQDPTFDALREEPRFAALVTRIGVQERWPGGRQE